LYANIDQTLTNSLHGLLNCEIGGLDCHVIITEYRTRAGWGIEKKHRGKAHVFHLICFKYCSKLTKRGRREEMTLVKYMTVSW